MKTGDRIHRAAVRAAALALPFAAAFNEKLRRGVAGRRSSLASMVAWSAAHRDDARPLVWLHAPSVGEALMAQAILTAVRESQPDVQAAFTFFSPSAERMAQRVGADWTGYLPWDTGADMDTALDALRPDCVAFVRTEIWPVLVQEARARGCGVLMVNGVLADGSSRLGRIARTLLTSAYSRLHAVGAVSDADAANFPLLGVTPDRITVTGDARFDQVVARVENLDRDRPLLRPFRDIGGSWLVAGSTWPADEQRLIPALATLIGTASWRAVIAPHEPTAAHVAKLEKWLDAAGLSHARLHTDEQPCVIKSDVVIVDRIGVLADLYAIADVAYVGGGFGSSGLHSVVEPAALGVPVVYGPRHGNAHEAERLAHAGGGFIASDADHLARVLDSLCKDTAVRQHAAAAAHDYVAAHTGGADRSAALILQHLSATR